VPFFLSWRQCPRSFNPFEKDNRQLILASARPSVRALVRSRCRDRRAEARAVVALPRVARDRSGFRPRGAGNHRRGSNSAQNAHRRRSHGVPTFAVTGQRRLGSVLAIGLACAAALGMTASMVFAQVDAGWLRFLAGRASVRRRRPRDCARPGDRGGRERMRARF
jgi:hypothetical protein